jgi:hypothetical protein
MSEARFQMYIKPVVGSCSVHINYGVQVVVFWGSDQMLNTPLMYSWRGAVLLFVWNHVAATAPVLLSKIVFVGTACSAYIVSCASLGCA